MLLKILSLLVICLAVTKACDLDVLLEFFYDDFIGDKDEGATQKPPNQSGVTQATAPAPPLTPRPKVTSINGNSPAATPFNFSRNARTYDHHRELYEDSPPPSRYAPNYQEPVVEHSMHSISINNHSEESAQEQDAHDDVGYEHYRFSIADILDKMLDLLKVGDSDDAKVEEIERNHHEDALLSILLKHLDHISVREHEHKHAHIAKQKRKHMRKEKKKMLKLLLLILEESYKHHRGKGHPHVSQKVMIQFPEVIHVNRDEVKPKDEEQIKCKFDEKNYVTCIKDRKVYETIKINPKDHSGIHKIDENVRYSMVKDDKAPKDEAKELMDKIFKNKHSHMQPHMGYDHEHKPYPYHNSRPYYNSEMDKDDYLMEQERFHHSPDYLSSRFNPDDKESSGGKSNVTAEAELSSNATVAATIAP